MLYPRFFPYYSDFACLGYIMVVLDGLRWELRHKGEKFYPDSYLADLRNQSLWVRARYVSPLRVMSGFTLKATGLLMLKKSKGRDLTQAAKDV